MRQSLQVLTVCLVVLVVMAYWNGYHRPYVPTFDPSTEVLFCASHGDGFMELGIRSIEHPDHQVPLLKIRSDDYEGLCTAWFTVNERLEEPDGRNK